MIFKVGDLVIIDSSHELIRNNYSHEIGKVYVVTKVYDNDTFDIDHEDPTKSRRASEYWKLAKNQIVVNILKDL